MPKKAQKPKSPYQLHTDRFIACWFNAAHPDADVAPGVVNNFKKLRENNPTATFSLIYSKNLLSKVGLKKIQKFAREFNVSLINFEKQLKALLAEGDERDQKLYEFAALELEHIEQPEIPGGPMFTGGGNPAAASDLCRWLSFICLGDARYIYIDAGDVIVNAKGVPKVLPVEVSILSTILVTPGNPEYYRNNDVLAFPYPTNDEARDAQISDVNRARDTLITNYSLPLRGLLEKLASKDPGGNIDFLYSNNMLDPFFEKEPDASLFSLRKWIQKHMDDTLYNCLKLRYPIMGGNIQRSISGGIIKEDPHLQPAMDIISEAYKTDTMLSEADFSEEQRTALNKSFMKLFAYERQIKIQQGALEKDDASQLYRNNCMAVIDTRLPLRIRIRAALKIYDQSISETLVSEISGPSALPKLGIYVSESEAISFAFSKGQHALIMEDLRRVTISSILHAHPALKNGFITYDDEKNISWIRGPSELTYQRYQRAEAPKVDKASPAFSPALTAAKQKAKEDSSAEEASAEKSAPKADEKQTKLSNS